MKPAHNEIEKYLYSTIGASFTLGSITWGYFTNPPKEEVGNNYVWSGINLLLEDGTKGSYIGEYLLELTIVSRATAGYTTNADIDACMTYLGQLLDVKGRQITTDSFNFIHFRLTSIEPSVEKDGQQTVIVRKLIFSILAEEI